MVHCLSPNGATTVVGDALPDRLLVATRSGVVVADRAGDRFVERTRVLADRHVSSLWYDAESGTVLAGSYDGGVFASTDDGLTFSLAGDALRDHNVYTVAINPTSGDDRWYAGTEPVALFVSDDRGKSWRELPAIGQMPGREKWTFPAPPHVAHLKNLTFVPGEPDHLFAAVEQGGLFESRDGGESFVEIESFVQPDDAWYRDVHRIALRPGDPRVMLATGGDGVARSDDAGASWRRVLPTSSALGYPDGLVIHPNDPDLVLIAGASDQPGTWRTSHCADAHVARSRDGGTTFTVVGSGLGEPLVENIEALSLGVAGDASEVLAGTTGGEVYASRDLGETFTLVLSGLASISKGGHYLALVERA